ncbi:MAG: helix-turn-helix transcriptional regulator [Candidatus Onthovivens sp.]|nr:helix-turn-helix transcriptional regulator [Candidatus Onthovivens sp.]
MNIGENIKKYRKEKKITQKLLAHLINKNIRTVQKYENGEIEPPLEVLINISEVLKVTVNELTGEKQLTSSQQFLNDAINKYGETLKSLSEKTGVPLNELEALYNNTNGCTVGTYKKLYNSFGLSDKEALNFLVSDSKINSIYNNNGINENFNIMRDMFLGKVDLEKDLGINVNYDTDMEKASTEFMNTRKGDILINKNPNDDEIEYIKGLDINSILSSELYLCDYKKTASIYEIEDIYKNEINQLKQLHQMEINNLKERIENMEQHINDIKISKKELHKIIDQKNLIIENLKEIIYNSEKNNSQPK